MLTLSTPFLRGKVIDERLFGGNLVFSQDDVNGTFPIRAEAAGLEIIRFPGGHVTEAFFDPANPDADSVTFVNGEGQTVTLDLVPLSDFLDYALEDDLGAIIVVPIQRYLDAWHEDGAVREDILTAEDKLAVRGYIQTVLASGVPIHAIEIGNEPIISGVDNMDYGQIVNEMVLVVHDAIDDFEAIGTLPDGYVHPLLSMVTVPHFAAIDTNGDGIETFDEALEERVAQLTPEAIANIEAITIHRYVSGDYEAIDGFQAPWLQTDQADAMIGRDLDLVLSEWNISSTQHGVYRWATATEEEREGLDTGLKHAGAVVAMFHEMVVNHVDIAAFWAVQQQNDVGFALREGTTSDLRAGGQIFAYLSENVQGMQAVELDRPSPDFDLHAFAGAEGQFIVINSRLGAMQTIDLDIGALTGPVDGGWVHVMTAAEGQDPRDPNVATVIEQIPLSEVLVDGRLTLSLDPWEIAILSVDADQDKIFADGSDSVILAGNGEDFIEGSYMSEMLDGGLHGDVILGGGGRDTVMGGDGNDTLYGNWDNDRLEGGQGDDVLHGQRGTDRLYGDAGNDYLDGGQLRDHLYGGDGDDTLVGGRGHDWFWGGEGADVFRLHDGDEAWREPINDFDAAEDRIELLFEDLTFDDIFLSQEESNAILNYGHGSLTLVDTDVDDLTEAHFGFL